MVFRRKLIKIIFLQLLMVYCCSQNKAYSQIKDINKQGNILPNDTANNKLNPFVQFSGIIITEDSLKPIPFVNIFMKNLSRGTITDFNGFFSFVAHKGDVISFECIGYKTIVYKIPDTLTSNRYTIIQIMRPDTLISDETFIYPWASYEQFKQAFLSLNVPDDQMERARKNIEILERRLVEDDLVMDGSMNYRNYIDNKIQNLYWQGQYRPITLLNPFAWAQFIKAWKQGKFKNKKKKVN